MDDSRSGTRTRDDRSLARSCYEQSTAGRYTRYKKWYLLRVQAARVRLCYINIYVMKFRWTTSRPSAGAAPGFQLHRRRRKHHRGPLADSTVSWLWRSSTIRTRVHHCDGQGQRPFPSAAETRSSVSVLSHTYRPVVFASFRTFTSRRLLL